MFSNSQNARYFLLRYKLQDLTRQGRHKAVWGSRLGRSEGELIFSEICFCFRKVVGRLWLSSRSGHVTLWPLHYSKACPRANRTALPWWSLVFGEDLVVLVDRYLLMTGRLWHGSTINRRCGDEILNVFAYSQHVQTAFNQNAAKVNFRCLIDRKSGHLIDPPSVDWRGAAISKRSPLINHKPENLLQDLVRFRPVLPTTF